jgi:hypothetical protein
MPYHDFLRCFMSVDVLKAHRNWSVNGAHSMCLHRGEFHPRQVTTTTTTALVVVVVVVVVVVAVMVVVLFLLLLLLLLHLYLCVLCVDYVPTGGLLLRLFVGVVVRSLALARSCSPLSLSLYIYIPHRTTRRNEGRTGPGAAVGAHEQQLDIHLPRAAHQARYV